MLSWQPHHHPAPAAVGTITMLGRRPRAAKTAAEAGAAAPSPCSSHGGWAADLRCQIGSRNRRRKGSSWGRRRRAPRDVGARELLRRLGMRRQQPALP
jgi:hypothetical protein